MGAPVFINEQYKYKHFEGKRKMLLIIYKINTVKKNGKKRKQSIEPVLIPPKHASKMFSQLNSE